ncbi:MAG: cell wall hydrolase [Clostridia bacterium]|nr:cell wall hydrolase [Clostridia bacterium]
MYVPLRGLAGVLHCDITYDGAARRVTLSTPEETASNNDAVYWLARIIEAESGAEPYRGKLAVGNVILNRVKSADFPNSIYGVIFDRKNGVQFTPVANGTIYNTPSEESVRAAKDCLSGTSVVGNCLYFFNPKTATKAGWIIQNCRYFASIGNHDFYLSN